MASIVIEKTSGSSSSGNDDGNDNEISIGDLLYRKPALLRMLITIKMAGDQGISTLELLNKLHSTHHGQQTLKLCQKKGYVERVKKKVPKGQKGNMIIMNRLTPKGKHVIAGIPIRPYD